MSQILNKDQIAQKVLEEFLQSELGDYFFKWSIRSEVELNDIDNSYFTVNYNTPCRENHCLEFCYNIKEEKLYIYMGGDIYEKIDNYSWKVRYFWMMINW